jgi:alpha-mannosidase
VRVYNDLRRIDVTTELLNQEAFVRYRAIFPTTLSGGTEVEEIPFGAIERPEQQEFPAQNWADYSSGGKGLTLLNRGIPGNNIAEGELMLSLLRSSNLASYPLIGGNEPGVGSDTGLGVGRKYTFEYALLPHIGGWRSILPWRAGLEFNIPLISRTVSSHHGPLPTKWGLLELSPDNVVLSALKLGDGGSIVLRVYEAAGKQTDHVHVSLHSEVKHVYDANLIEDIGRELTSTPNGFTFDLRSFEIRTFVLDFQPSLVTKAETRH